MAELLYKPGCPNCQKAIDWLSAHGIEAEPRPLPEQAPDAEELREWLARSGGSLRSFWNTDEVSFRSFRVFTSSRMLSEEHQRLVLAGDPAFIRHPVLITEERVLPGFMAELWEAKLLHKPKK